MNRKFITVTLAIFFLQVVSVHLNSLLAQKNQSSWNAPSWTDTLKNPYAKDGKAWKKVEQTFNTLCTICHGSKGLGDGIAGVALNPRPANLISSRVQNQSDGAIFWKMTTGKAPMASYKASLSEEQRWQFVKLIRELAKK